MTNLPQLLIDSGGPEIRHRTGISAPDAFFYLREADDSETVFFDAREYEIQKEKLAKLGSPVHTERLEPYQDRALAATDEPGTTDEKALLLILQDRGISEVAVSKRLPFGWAAYLQDRGIRLVPRDFTSDRRHKSERELDLLRETQRTNEGAHALVRDILAASEIDGEFLRWRGEILTSEAVKSEIRKYFLERDFSCPEGIIVASGEQSARPHDDGTGPLRAHSLIIIDIFPRNDGNGYFGDMTRTWCRGTPTPEMQRMFDAVRGVQAEMCDLMEVGMVCSDVYDAAVRAFAARGFEASPERGFMHGLGHSLGLEVHEDPRTKPGYSDLIEPGMVLTVEPGLYFPSVGGVRIEDIVVFHQDGRKENLNTLEKTLIIN